MGLCVHPGGLPSSFLSPQWVVESAPKVRPSRSRHTRRLETVVDHQGCRRSRKIKVNRPHCLRLLRRGSCVPLSCCDRASSPPWPPLLRSSQGPRKGATASPRVRASDDVRESASQGDNSEFWPRILLHHMHQMASPGCSSLTCDPRLVCFIHVIGTPPKRAAAHDPSQTESPSASQQKRGQ